MSYSPFDPTKPAGSDAGTAVCSEVNVNELALRDAILMGGVNGFAYSQTVGTGTAEMPQYMFWTNGATILRATLTWGSSGGSFDQVTQIIWDISYNTGSTYNNICTETRTYDSNANLTATTNAGGFMAWLMGLFGKYKTLLASFNAHTVLTGTAAHGLGTMSTQSAGAVAITGGNLNSVAIGQSTPGAGNFTRASESINATYTPASNASVTLDWSNGSSVVTNSGANAISFSNVPSGVLATHLVRVSAFNNCTWPASLPNGNWGSAGKPSISGAAEVCLWTRDGGTTVYAGIGWS